MAAAKFRPGQIVEFTSRSHTRSAGHYEILRQVPSETGEIRYRVRSLEEPHERVASEHELQAVTNS